MPLDAWTIGIAFNREHLRRPLPVLNEGFHGDPPMTTAMTPFPGHSLESFPSGNSNESLEPAAHSFRPIAHTDTSRLDSSSNSGSAEEKAIKLAAVLHEYANSTNVEIAAFEPHHTAGRNATCMEIGVLLPFLDEAKWPTGVRIALYAILLLYLFVGIAVGSHIFMAAIKRITSRRLKLRIKSKSTGELKYKYINVWNPTIANLTLMAMGTSAAEILLSLIQVIGHNFEAGEIGPGSIVGSAAFNHLFITAVCIWSAPTGASALRIKRFSVYLITVGFNFIAYIWLIIILLVTSPNVIEVWEAAITFSLFWLMLIISYAADKKFCGIRQRVGPVVATEFYFAEKSAVYTVELTERIYANGSGATWKNKSADAENPIRSCAAAGGKFRQAGDGGVISLDEPLTNGASLSDALNRSSEWSAEFRQRLAAADRKPAEMAWYHVWLEQIFDSIQVEFHGDPMQSKCASLCRYLKHVLTFGWRFLYAFVPPPCLLCGWPAFVTAMCLIGLKATIIGDAAEMLGCLCGMDDMVTASTLVAVGTSLPELFTSRFAAQNDDTADNAIGNINGSNCANVLFGLGLPWLIAAIHWESKGQLFNVDAGDIANNVVYYTTAALLLCLLLFLRRQLKFFGRGELGGPLGFKVFSAVFLTGLWIAYMVLATLNVYGHIVSF